MNRYNRQKHWIAHCTALMQKIFQQMADRYHQWTIEADTMHAGFFSKYIESSSPVSPGRKIYVFLRSSIAIALAKEIGCPPHQVVGNLIGEVKAVVYQKDTQSAQLDMKPKLRVVFDSIQEMDHEKPNRFVEENFMDQMTPKLFEF